MESNNVSIKNWSDEDRPREKLVNKGIAYLSDAELLTILIGTGTKNKSALDLANEIIKLYHSQLEEKNINQDKNNQKIVMDMNQIVKTIESLEQRVSTIHFDKSNTIESDFIVIE